MPVPRCFPWVRPRRGSSLITVLILMASVGLLVAGLAVYQAFALRTLQGRSGEAQTASGAQGVARALAERLGAVATSRLGVFAPEDWASMATETEATLTSLETGYGDAIRVVRDSEPLPLDLQQELGLPASVMVPRTGYIVLRCVGPACYGVAPNDSSSRFMPYLWLGSGQQLTSTSRADTPLPAEGRPLTQSTDVPRRGPAQGSDVTGQLGLTTLEVEIRATVEGPRGARLQSRGRLRISKVPPWQEAVTFSGPQNAVFPLSPIYSPGGSDQHRFGVLNSGTGQADATTGGRIIVSGPLRVDGLFVDNVAARPLLQLSGPTITRDGAVTRDAASGFYHAVMPDGASTPTILASGLGDLTRESLEAGVGGPAFARWSLPTVLAVTGGTVQPTGALGLPISAGRQQTAARQGRGECADALLAWPADDPVVRGVARQDQIGCISGTGDLGHALFSPDIQVRAVRSDAPNQLRFVLGPGAWLSSSQTSSAGHQAPAGRLGAGHPVTPVTDTVALRQRLESAITYRWPLPTLGATLDASSLVGSDGVAYVSPAACGPTCVNGRAPWSGMASLPAPGSRPSWWTQVRVWRGILPDPRRVSGAQSGQTALAFRPGTPPDVDSASFATIGRGTDPFGYLVDLEALGNALGPNWGRQGPDASAGLFLSFGPSEDPRLREATTTAAQVRSQESVVLWPPRRANHCIAGPLTIHSRLPVYLVGGINDWGCQAQYRPLMIDAPSITVIPAEAAAQVLGLLPGEAPWVRWDLPGWSNGRPLPMMAWGAAAEAGEIRIGAVLRVRPPLGLSAGTPAWAWAPQILGDFSRVGLAIQGSVEGVVDGYSAAGRDPLVAHSLVDATWVVRQSKENPADALEPLVPHQLLTAAAVEPRYRHYRLEPNLLSAGFQPPGSWHSIRTGAYASRDGIQDAPWPQALRTARQQRRTWWGGQTVVQLLGGFTTGPARP